MTYPHVSQVSTAGGVADRTFPVLTVPGLTLYTAATMNCETPQMNMPIIRKTRRRPILEMTQLLTMMTKTPTAVRMQAFMKAFPTLAISKKYVPYAFHH